jgi:H+/Cl- antiporter ClcA
VIKKLKALSLLAVRHRYGLTLFAYLFAAAATGAACWLFMKGFEFVLDRRLDFNSIGPWAWVATPVLFLLAVELVRRIAPCAAGTGIPQAVFAAENLSASNEKRLWPLVSGRTLTVKVLALLLGVWAGASTGREGPTVHIATCVFLGLMVIFRSFTGISFDLRSAVVAGGAAGLAAAFNTPLAGVTFAVEELTADSFSSIKDVVLMAIIVAAIAAKALTGDYTYFGRLSDPADVTLWAVLAVGLVGGAAGAFFSTTLLAGQRWTARLSRGAGRWALPVFMSLALLAVAALFGTRVLGPGNKSAQALLSGEPSPWIFSFPWTKMAATLLTYWSGLAGGIFAPCLAIGAALGADVAHWIALPVAGCALIGMAAFLSGTIQAPITAFVIIFEMTGRHDLLLPVMLASLIAFMTARVLGARHLYQTLSDNYRFMLGSGSLPGETEARPTA